MKTLEELVNKLNGNFGSSMRFMIRRNDEINTLFLSVNFAYEDEDIYRDIVEYEYHYKSWVIRPEFGYVTAGIQKIVVDFLSDFHKESYDYLYQEKKYYIAIGQYDDISNVVYYKKKDGSGFSLCTKIDFDEKHLQDEEILTEKEIEELKATLPANMARIVELGKVEVK